MRNTGKIINTCFALLVGMFLQTVTVADGDSSWKAEFERICAQTEIAISLSAKQLHELIKDSDELLEQLGQIEDPWAKIYISRIRKCRDFFKFTLEWQALEQHQEQPG